LRVCSSGQCKKLTKIPSFLRASILVTAVLSRLYCQKRPWWTTAASC